MKHYSEIILLTLIGIFSNVQFVRAQTFVNGELAGSVCTACIPTSWQEIPFTDPFCQANSALEATVEVCDATGPSLGGGINGNPFSGATMVSGLHASNGGASTWHEGIMQTVNGFTPGNDYSICFYQTVVKQQNCLDESGSWSVYFDNTLIATTAPSTSTLPFDSNNLVWDQRTVTFTATAATHTIKFIPLDDDANLVTDLADITGALRMGIDLIQFSIPVDATLTPAGPFCVSDNAQQLVTATNGGMWSGNGITDPLNGHFDPAVAGVGSHIISYEIAGPCNSTITETMTIDVTSSDDASWIPPAGLCTDGTAVNLDNLVTGSSGGTWSGTGVTGNMFDPFGLAGPISITYTVGSGACQGISTQDINVVSLNSNIQSTPISCNGANDGLVSIAPSGGTSYTHVWNDNSTNLAITFAGPGTYSVLITDNASSCTLVDSITLTEPPPIDLIMESSSGCSISAWANALASGGAGGFTYSWAPNGETTQQISNISEGTYTVTVTDGNGCSATADATIISVSAPTITTIQDTIISLGQEVPLFVTGATSYQWFDDYGLDCYDCENPIASPSTTTEYCAIGFANGCADTTCVKIYVNYDCRDTFVPSAFSPNDDGENDLLCVYNDCLEQIEFSIYNRWGEKVFESGTTSICWDGSWKGKELNSAVFVYTLRATTFGGQSIHKKGNISLIR